MRFAILTIGLHLGGAALAAQSQSLSVAVTFDDKAAGSLFQSGFAAAFRSLGDVVVVGLREDPDYVLTGVVICDPTECNNPVSYALAVRLYEPASMATARIIAFEAVPSEHLAKNREAVVAKIFETVRHYEETHVEWVVRWGRDRYEQATRELVRQIDAGCFDRIRALKRAGSSDEKGSWESYQAYKKSRSWLC